MEKADQIWSAFFVNYHTNCLVFSAFSFAGMVVVVTFVSLPLFVHGVIPAFEVMFVAAIPNHRLWFTAFITCITPYVVIVVQIGLWLCEHYFVRTIRAETHYRYGT